MKWSFLAAFLFGLANFLTGHLSYRLHRAGGYPFFISNLTHWIIYHLVTAIIQKGKSGTYWSKEESLYFDKSSKLFRKDRAMGPLFRGIVQICIFFSMFLTLEASHQADINQGIISSLFSTSIIFSSLLFYLLFKDKLTVRHLLGLLMMIVSVVLICMGKDRKNSSP